MMNNPAVCHNVFVSTRHRDTSKYPSASEFVIDAPMTLKKVHSVYVKSFKYVPEALINNNNNEFTFKADNGAVLQGTIRLPPGDYNESIDDLLTAINNTLATYGVHFTLDENDAVNFTFSNGFITRYFSIPDCRLLKLLGFTSGICLYRTGQAPSPLPSGTSGYEATAAATGSYKTSNDTDLILRIADIEAILSCDSVANRATAIIVSSRSNKHVVEHTPTTPYPLLQVQQRVQRLRISILNSEGLPYDIGDNEMSFVIEFHCHEPCTF